MKTATATVKNSMIYRTNRTDHKGNRLDIKISLADECKNGHNDFHITADFIEYGRKRVSECGCLHEKILDLAPDFKIFIDLHGSDYLGSPSYTRGNGFHFLTSESKESTCNYLRIVDQEYELLKIAKDELFFCFLLESLGIVDRWKSEAKNAIEVLEALTDSKFEDNSTKVQYEPLTAEEKKDIEDKVRSGYYSQAEIEKREEQKKEDKKARLLSKLKTAFEAKNLEVLQDYEIDKILIELFSTDSNVIFYKHTNTVVFNWSDMSHYKKYTETEFKSFLDIAKENEHLKDLKFELK